MTAPVEVAIAGTGELGGGRADWDGFAPSRANPGNSTAYASLYRALGRTPIFLEATIGGVKASQWLVSRRPRRFLPFASLSADAAPEHAEAALSRADDVFVAYVAFLRRRFWLQDLSVHKLALVRGLSEAALSRAGFRERARYGSYVAQIGGDEELLASFHSSHRNDTRKALREGYRYEEALPGGAYLPLSRETYERSGREGPEPALVAAIERLLVPAGEALVSGVFAGDVLEAASIVLYRGWSAFYLHGASSAGKPRGATTLIHYENMRRLRERGVRFYDFGGARIADDADPKARSLAAFKERFGGRWVDAHGGRYARP